MNAIECVRAIWGALERWLSPGPWNYASCCGCGIGIVNYQLVAIDENEEPAPYEQYCRPCWNTKPTLWPLEHVEYPAPLIHVPNREADRMFAEHLRSAA
jgi:hypothetical protein